MIATPAGKTGADGAANAEGRKRIGAIDCEICNATKAKYRCPRCEVQTCSIECIRAHKKDTGCSGKRDVTKYVSIQKFTDKTLHSDFHFLEGVRQAADGSKRRMEGLGGGRKRLHKGAGGKGKRRKKGEEGAGADGPGSEAADGVLELRSSAVGRSAKAKFLLGATEARGTRLVLLSHAMERRKSNTSWYKKAANTIYWRIKWVFPAGAGRNKDMFVVKDGVDEHWTLRKSIGAVLDVSLDNSLTRLRLKPYRPPCIEVDKLLFFMKQEDQPANTRRYYLLDKGATWKDVLGGKMVVEHPTIHVILPGEEGEKYPTVDAKER
jgi:hypothetical protein